MDERRASLPIRCGRLFLWPVFEAITMMMMWQIVSHVVITLIAVAALAVRIEHRLTKIETDVTWLTRNINAGGCEDSLDPRTKKGRSK